MKRKEKHDVHSILKFPKYCLHLNSEEKETSLISCKKINNSLKNYDFHSSRTLRNHKQSKDIKLNQSIKNGELRVEVKKISEIDSKHNPYKELGIVWAKYSSHPPWPSVYMSQEEIVEMELIDGLSLTQEENRLKTKCVGVHFLGK